MNPPRRQFLHLATGVAAIAALSRLASALDYPTGPVRIIVGFPAGTAMDVVARLLGERLSQRLGQAFVIENRPGASSNIAATAVAHAAPDGATLLMISTTNASNATLYDNLDFNFVRDIVPVAGAIRMPLVVVVNPMFPARTIPDFIAYAKAHPSKVTIASGGVGSPAHVASQLFKMMTGADMIHVPYRGNPVPDLLGGQVQVMFAPIAAVIELVRAGKLRALGITTANRSDALSDVPAVGELVPGYEASTWFGIGAPKGISAEIVERLNREINMAIVEPQMTARFAQLGVVAMPGSPAEFAKLIAEETEKWGRVVKYAGLKPE